MKCLRKRDYAKYCKILNNNLIILIRGHFSVFLKRPRIRPLKVLKTAISCNIPKNKNPCKRLTYRDFLVFAFYVCGERGIRTPGTSQFNGFQDRRNRPLCHLSFRGGKSRLFLLITKEEMKKNKVLEKKLR